jgi:hypothetical protein
MFTLKFLPASLKAQKFLFVSLLTILFRTGRLLTRLCFAPRMSHRPRRRTRGRRSEAATTSFFLCEWIIFFFAVSFYAELLQMRSVLAYDSLQHPLYRPHIHPVVLAEISQPFVLAIAETPFPFKKFKGTPPIRSSSRFI